MAVALYVRAQARLSHPCLQPDVRTDVMVRIRPRHRSSVLPLPQDPIDTPVIDHRTCRVWLDALTSATLMTWRQRDGRHIRARTVDANREHLEMGIEEMLIMLGTRRWEPVWNQDKSCWPLPAWLELMFSRAVHFLCLLHRRLADGALPADIWKRIILETLPTLTRFVYARSSVGGPQVEILPLPLLPGEREGENQVDAQHSLSALLTFQDAAALTRLSSRWSGLSLEPLPTDKPAVEVA